MPQGQARDYDEQALFRLEIDDIEVCAFSKCSEFKDESGVIEQREGGNKEVAWKGDGVIKREPLTLERGANAKNFDLYNWREDVKLRGATLAARNAHVVQLNPDGSVKGRISLEAAWPSSYSYGPWDGSADDTSKEIVVLQFLKGKRVKLS